MTKDELELYIDKQQKIAWTLSKDIVLILANLRSIVGHCDIAKNIVLNEDEFNKIVKNTEEELDKRGYNLFEDLK